jgi:hypothetical protein
VFGTGWAKHFPGQAQAALQPYHPEKFLPGPSVGEDEASLAKAAGDIGTAIFHPIGTASGRSACSAPVSGLNGAARSSPVQKGARCS